MPRKKTVKNTLSEVRELEQLAAVYSASANWLKTRYISRDSAPAVSQVSCNGAPVPEEVVELAIARDEALAKELTDTAEAMLAKEVSDG